MLKTMMLALTLLVAQLSLQAHSLHDQDLTAKPIAHKERTLSIVKPDAVQAKHIGDVMARFEKNGLRIVGIKMLHLSKPQAKEFYAVHKERPFYPDLVDYMSSGPVVALILEGENAVAKNRELMGATDPKKATSGTLRADFGTSVQQNAVHGSDSAENAKAEIIFFFKPDEIMN